MIAATSWRSVVLQSIKQQLASAAILDQRILLANAHPVNALAQVVHVFEVLHPEVVEHLQVDVALDFAHNLGGESRFAGRVQLLGLSLQDLLELSGVGIEQFIERGFVERERFRALYLQTDHW